MLPVESLKFLDQLSREATDPKTLEQTDPRVKRELINGQVVETHIAPGLRQSHITDLTDLPAAAARWGAANGVAWVSADGVRLIFDDATRDEVLICDLRETALFSHVSALQEGRWIDQKDFLDFLIEVIGDNMTPTIIPIVSKIRATIGSRTTSEIGNARDKGTAEFLNEVLSEDGMCLPDTVTIRVQPFLNLPFVAEEHIKCRLKSRPQPLVFMLAPLADEINMAIASTLRNISMWLSHNLPERGIGAGDGTAGLIDPKNTQPFPVFIGTPR